MEWEKEERRRGAEFRPRLEGCVTRNPGLARAMEWSYLAELHGVSGYGYAALITERSEPMTAEIFDRIARDETRHFRMLGELILSLGVNPAVRTRVRLNPAELREGELQATEGAVKRMREEFVREKRLEIDRYQTLLGKTEDRVVRSLLAHILDDEEKHLHWLNEGTK